MNEKALVEVFVPAAGETYDVMIPLDSMMSDVLDMLATLLSEMSSGRYKADKSALLCEKNSGIIYNINMKVSEVGIQNGTQLMLI